MTAVAQHMLALEQASRVKRESREVRRDWGEKTRRELREAWDRHVESQDRRQVAALTSGGALKQLDPLASLQLGSGL